MQGFPSPQLNANVLLGAIMLYPDFPVESSNKVIPEAWGWMICDGKALDARLYPELYAVIGTLYNKSSDADGSFRLPDLGVQQINNLSFRYVIKFTYSIIHKVIDK